MDYWTLGDIQTLDAISIEFDTRVKSANTELIKETAETAELLEKTGIAFPYDPVLEQNTRIFLQIGSSVAARQWGEHWQLSGEECEKLSIALCQVITHYMPDFERMGPAGNLAIVAGSVLGPRALLTFMQKKQPQPPQEQKETTHAA